MATSKGALLGCYRARIEHSSACPIVDTTADDACLVIVGGLCAALLGASPVGSEPALARPFDVTTASHASSTPGSPLSCNPPLGEVGPVVEGSSILGVVGSTTVGCSTVGATGSTLAYACSAWGAIGSSGFLPSSVANGCKTSIDSTLQQKRKIRQEAYHRAKGIRQINKALTTGTPAA